MKRTRLILMTLVLLVACQETRTSVSSGRGAAPTASADSYALKAERLDVSLEDGVLANDKGDELSAVLETAPAHGSLDLNGDGSFTYNFEGDTDVREDSFVYLAKNAAGEQAATVTLTVLPPDVPGTPENAAPTAEADSYSLDEGGALNVTAAGGLLANDADPEGQALSLEVLSEPARGVLNMQPDGSFSYVHDHSETTADSFSYRVSDGVGSSSAVVSLTITAVDDVPVVETLRVAQTHVMKPGGITWEGEKLSERELHVVGNREALLLVELSAANNRVADAVVEAYENGEKLGEVALNSPETLPPTEADGPAYSDNMHWVNLDKAWVKPGLNLSVRANEGQMTEVTPVKVGAATKFTMYTLPFYLFGLDETDIAFKDVAAPDEDTQDAYFARHPVSELEMVNHPAKKVEWPYVIVPPRTGKAAYKITNKNQQKDGYDTMDAVLRILQTMRYANGDGPLADQYYAPMLMADEDGNYAYPGGGWGGGSAGTGDYAYRGVFIHEGGHAFGMPHSRDGYNNGTYPYVGGSLKGSTWGYDQENGKFISNFVPKTSGAFAGCDSNLAFQKDEEGRCVRQDIMQGGGGHRAAGDLFSIFSDFNAGVVQRHLEARPIKDGSSASGYSIWDKDSGSYVDYATVPLTNNERNGLYGNLNRRLPVQQGVPVSTVILTRSQASTGLTQIYPPISYTGNLLQTIDAANSADLAKIELGKGDHPWYCLSSGCDYTLRVTYADNSTKHIVLAGGFRKFNNSAEFRDDMNEPTSSDSFAQWGVNIDGSKAIKKLELLDTPQVYNGLPDTPTVLATWPPAD